MAETIVSEIEAKPAPSSTFTELNVRQDQGIPHFVRLHDSVVKAMERRLAETPGEALGILLGSVVSSESCRIDVEEFAPVINLGESIRARDGQRIVGYYRAHAESELSLQTRDQALFKKCFPQGVRLALLLKPATTGVATAMFFLGENGALAADRATVEFPFNLRELGAEDPGPVAVVPIASAPSPVVAEPARGSSLWKIALGWTVAIGVAIGAYGLHNRKAPAEVVVAKPAVIEQPAEAPAPAPAAVESRPETPVARVKPPVAAPTPKQTASPPPLDIRRPPLRQAVEIPAPSAIVPATPMALPQTVVTAPVAEPPAREQIPVPTAPAPVSTAPASKAPEPAKPYTPPRAIRQYAPILKDNVRRSIIGEMPVRLRVYVDATGRVIGADPLNVSSPVADALAAAAITAVKRWQFEPARRGDEKVTGEIELSFTFRK